MRAGCARHVERSFGVGDRVPGRDEHRACDDRASLGRRRHDEGAERRHDRRQLEHLDPRRRQAGDEVRRNTVDEGAHREAAGAEVDRLVGCVAADADRTAQRVEGDVDLIWAEAIAGEVDAGRAGVASRVDAPEVAADRPAADASDAASEQQWVEVAEVDVEDRR